MELPAGRAVHGLDGVEPHLVATIPAHHRICKAEHGSPPVLGVQHLSRRERFDCSKLNRVGANFHVAFSSGGRRRGGLNDLFCLSPFHNHDCSRIRRTNRALGASSHTYGRQPCILRFEDCVPESPYIGPFTRPFPLVDGERGRRGRGLASVESPLKDR